MSHLIVGVGSVESAFLTSATPTVQQHDHKDLPALLVLIQYLTQVGDNHRYLAGRGGAMKGACWEGL